MKAGKLWVEGFILKINSEDKSNLPYINFLSDKRQELIHNYVFYGDKHRSLWSALLTKKILEERSGIKLNEQKFIYNIYGKPQLANSNISFNISHSVNRIFLCCSNRTEVGVDVEKIEDAPLQIMDYLFHKNEIAYVLSGRTYEKNHRFYEIWTRKEAYAKCVGNGISEELRNFDSKHEEVSNHFWTWEQDGYCFSIYLKDLLDVHISTVEQSELERFYTKL